MTHKDTSLSDKAAPQRRMLGNLVWNLSGVILPLIAAAFSAPILLDQLGGERFGLLTLAWTLIGYFSIFDLGLGRSVAKIVSQRLGDNPQADVAPIVWTAILTALSAGAVAGCATAFWADSLISLMNLDPGLHEEAGLALRVLALTLPIVVTSSILVGALEAYHRFDIVNKFRLPAGLVNFLAPLAVVPFSHNIVFVVLVLGICKLVVTIGYLAACGVIIREFKNRIHFSRAELHELLTFGGWITLGNILSPIVVYTDRFLITAYVSVTVVGYYVLPFEVLMRVLVPVVAVTAVLFPTFSSEIDGNQARVSEIYGISLKSIMLVSFPITFLLAAWSGELLQLWLNEDVAQAAYLVTKFFALGIFLTCLNQVTLTLIQASGRPDLMPKLFMAELPIYLPCLVWAVKLHGIEGAAAVWLLRIFVDFVFLFWFTAGSLPFIRALANSKLPYLLLLLALFSLTVLDLGLLSKLMISLASITLPLVLGWLFVFEAGEKNILLDRLKLGRHQG